jgi:adenylate kinase
MPTRILVCGIAGVGKSYMLARAREVRLDASIYRASEIIGKARQNLDGEFLRNLPHDEMAASQQLLVAGFNQQMLSCTSELVFLDGHSVIDNDYGMFPVQSAILAGINLDGIFHIEDDVGRIFSRRSLDSARARPLRTPEQLAAYQQLSLATCEEIAGALSLPMTRVSADNLAGFLRLVMSL